MTGSDLARFDEAVIDDRLWHLADIKLRPQFGRYGVESGQHLLVVSFSAFDPKRTSSGSERKPHPPSFLCMS
jgi:hypothetical protein